MPENIHLTDSETATILAALRTYQRMKDNLPMTDSWKNDIQAIATGGGEHDQMENAEIDSLCEKLNV